MPGFNGGTAASGAATGAAAGSVFGPIGVGVGAAVGGLAGGFIGGKKPSFQEDPDAARLNRASQGDWQTYWKQYAPRQQQLTDFATSGNDGAVRASAADVDQQFGIQEQAQQRRLAGQGITLTQEQKAASARDTNIAQGLAESTAGTSTLQGLRGMKESILGGF